MIIHQQISTLNIVKEEDEEEGDEEAEDDEDEEAEDEEDEEDEDVGDSASTQGPAHECHTSAALQTDNYRADHCLIVLSQRGAMLAPKTWYA